MIDLHSLVHALGYSVLIGFPTVRHAVLHLHQGLEASHHLYAHQFRLLTFSSSEPKYNNPRMSMANAGEQSLCLYIQSFGDNPHHSCHISDSGFRID
jgi:hypothetical protein